MAETIYARKAVGGLVPWDDVDAESLSELPSGKRIKLVCTVARSNPQNRWFHKVLHVLYDMQDERDPIPTRPMFKRKVKEWCGFGTWYHVRGHDVFEPRSTAFEKTDQVEFNQFVNTTFIPVIQKYILPRFEKSEIAEMLLLLDADTGALGARIFSTKPESKEQQRTGT